MIVFRIRSSGHIGPRISLVQIKLSQCHCYSPLSLQVTSNDKTPTVISSALEKHNQDPKQASRYELIQLLPEGKGKDVFKKFTLYCYKMVYLCYLKWRPNWDHLFYFILVKQSHKEKILTFANRVIIQNIWNHSLQILMTFGLKYNLSQVSKRWCRSRDFHHLFLILYKAAFFWTF